MEIKCANCREPFTARDENGMPYNEKMARDLEKIGFLCDYCAEIKASFQWTILKHSKTKGA